MGTVGSFILILSMAAFGALVLVPLGFFVFLGFKTDLVLMQYHWTLAILFVVLFYAGYFLLYIKIARWKSTWAAVLTLCIPWIMGIGGLVLSIINHAKKLVD